MNPPTHQHCRVPDLVYILAASHSGSTLLAMLLGAHPQAVTVGELSPSNIGDLAQYRCSCHARFLECAFWQRVAGALAAHGADFALDDFHTRYQAVSGPLAQRLLRPLHRGPLLETLRDAALSLCPSWRAAYPRLRDNNRALIDVLREISGRSVVIDSSKSAVRLKFLLRIPDLDIKVVRLIRDGRGVALACVDPERFADAADPGLRGRRSAERRSLAVAAHEWRRSNDEAECLLARLDRRRWIDVRYERLCSDPEAVLHDVFSFLGLDPARRVRDFRTAEHHVLGNGMRLDTTSDIRLDERWRTELTREDLAVFERIAGKLNRAYGYVSSTTAAQNERRVRPRPQLATQHL